MNALNHPRRVLPKSIVCLGSWNAAVGKVNEDHFGSMMITFTQSYRRGDAPDNLPRRSLDILSASADVDIRAANSFGGLSRASSVRSDEDPLAQTGMLRAEAPRH
jgi:hypothetical protein